MCLKRKPPPKERGIKTGEVQTKVRTVPIGILFAAESRSITKGKMASRMAKLLQIGVESGAMSDDWTKQAQSLIDQAESVNPEVLVISYDEIDGSKEERMEALIMTLDELVEKVAEEKPYRTRKSEVENIVTTAVAMLEAEVGVELVTRKDKSE
ncbi:hypothetical protein [Maridesulfovibrio sp.]|uniref:hypothetical protein n=1 Tax=Maridesulfovibrio sp. TaxID=2795000 RepID=UPI002AA92619|nr:hypothetical protein [Maridesulfovibrio sp.]